MGKKRAIFALLALLLAVLLPVRAQALGLIDTEQPVTLTLAYESGGKAIAGAAFSLYRVAEVSASGEFTLTGSFAGYPVSLQDRSANGWRALALTLEAYAERDNLKPLAAGTTNRQGLLTFPAAGETLLPGLYLVLGEAHESGNNIYTAEPFLVSLPETNDTGTKWVYAVTAAPKSDKDRKPDDSEEETIRRRVRKVWNDNGDKANRPSKVVAQLLRNGRVYDTVTLSEKNNWRYTWEDLDAEEKWTVVEREVPAGYTVSLTKEGATFVLTNTSTSNPPDNPPPGNPPPDTPNPPNSPTNPNDPGNPDTPHQPDASGPSAPSGGARTDAAEHTRLPQTGVLWWPVPVLLAAGLALLIVGCVRRRRDNG